MRLSRKRARRIAAEREKQAEREREAAERAQREAAEARVRYDAACKGALLPSRRYPHRYRMTRAPRRNMLVQKARERLAKQVAVTTAFSAACLTRLLGTASAAYHDPMHDIAGQLNALRDQRDELRVYHEAAANLRAAREALANARQNLADAKQGVIDAKNNVAEAKQDLATSQQALADAKEALRQARAISAEKTQAAIAAQQAAYDYQQEVYARQAAVDELAAEQSSAEAQAEAAGVRVRTGNAVSVYSNREAAVQKALAEVGYEQNRLADAIRLADAYTNGEIVEDDATSVADEAAQAEADAWASRIDEISSALDDAESSLDEAQSYLEELEDARADAEEEEADARADERAAETDEQQAEADVAASETYLAEAENDQQSAIEWEAEATADLEETTRDEGEIAHDLFTFGTGASLQTGVEYAHAQGNVPRTGEDANGDSVYYADAYHGHQLYVPFSLSDTVRLDRYPGQANVNADPWPGGEARHMLDLGISTGWLGSYTTPEHGDSAGLTDTTLDVRYRSDHPVNSLRYGLTINLPTGQHRFYANALVPKGLLLFEDFGKGWEFTPSIEAVHRVTERDSLIARFAYTFREKYKYAKEVSEAETNPGGVADLELAYQHIGENHQLRTWITLSDTAETKQDQIVRDNTGWHLGTPVKYREGTEIELGAAVNWRIAPKDELGAFLMLGHAQRVHGIAGDATDDIEFAVGLRHAMTPRLSWEALASAYHSTTGYSALYLDEGTNSDAWTRWSLLGILDYRMTDVDRLTLNLERYIRSGLGSNDYQGYTVALWYTRSF